MKNYLILGSIRFKIAAISFLLSYSCAIDNGALLNFKFSNMNLKQTPFKNNSHPRFEVELSPDGFL